MFQLKNNAIQANDTSGLVKKMITMQILNEFSESMFKGKLGEAKLATKKYFNTFEKSAFENKRKYRKIINV